MESKQNLLLSIDIGTTNWKVAAFSLEGKAVCVKKTPTITHYDNKNNSYYRHQEIWSSVSDLIRQVVSVCNGKIVAISATSMAEAVVPIDKDGAECFDIITWFDTRSAKQAQDISNIIGRERLYSITGLDPNPIFTLSKMLWVKENCPEVYNKSVKWLQMTDYMIYKLTGIIRTDYSLASRTLAFDVANNCWSDEILRKVGVDVSLFPDIVESGTVVGNITKKAGEETGLDVYIPVVMGGNDHPCAALPAGVLNGRKILDSSGTAESIILVSEKNMKPVMVFNGQRTCRFLDSSRYALFGGIITSAASFDWIYKTVTSVAEWGYKQPEFGYDDILEQIMDTPAGSNGLIFLPHLRGSGAPNWNPKMKGSFLGIKSTTTQKDMIKAVLEGLCFQAKMIVDMHKKISGMEPEALCVVGGSGKNWLWQQIKADILQLPIEICAESDATALGAAMLAGVGIGIYKDITYAAKEIRIENKVLVPNKNMKSFYDELYELYIEGYNATVKISERLHDLNIK